MPNCHDFGDESGRYHIQPLGPNCGEFGYVFANPDSTNWATGAVPAGRKLTLP